MNEQGQYEDGDYKLLGYIILNVMQSGDSKHEISGHPFE